MAGADGQDRTGDLSITNRLLYRLSYIGLKTFSFVRVRLFILTDISCQGLNDINGILPTDILAWMSQHQDVSIKHL
jgi:hypothetical protein